MVITRKCTCEELVTSSLLKSCDQSCDVEATPPRASSTSLRSTFTCRPRSPERVFKRLFSRSSERENFMDSSDSKRTVSNSSSKPVIWSCWAWHLGGAVNHATINKLTFVGARHGHASASEGQESSHQVPPLFAWGNCWVECSLPSVFPAHQWTGHNVCISELTSYLKIKQK